MARFTAPSRTALLGPDLENELQGTVTTNITGDGVTNVTDPEPSVTDRLMGDTGTGDFSYTGDTVDDQFTDPTPTFSGPANPDAVGGGGGIGIGMIAIVIGAVALIAALLGGR